MVLKYNFHPIQLIYLILVLYSLSSPWPKNVTAIEIGIGILLIMSLLTPIMYYFLHYKEIKTTNILFIIIFLIGMINSIVYKNSLFDIVRDVVPYIYLVIGYAIFKTNYQKKLNYIVISNLIVFIGIIYSFRSYYEWADRLGDIGKQFLMSPSYIIQSPAVLYASVFLVSYSAFLFYKNYKLAFIYFSLGIIPLGALAAQILRAPVLFTLLSFFFVLVYNLKYKYNVLKKSIVFFFLGTIIILSSNILISVFDLLMLKQETAGQSGKLTEYIEAFRYLSHDVYSFFFGKGFGGLWTSPTARGVEISYTHSIINYFFIKFGLIGLFFSVYLIYLWFKILISDFRKTKNIFNKSVILAIGTNLIISGLLEPAYKTLSFGFIVFLIYLVHQEVQNESTII